MGAVRFDLVGDFFLAPNDDDYVGPISLPWPFLGYDQVFVNNNGSVGFTWGSREYVPTPLGGVANAANTPNPGLMYDAGIGPCIAAYWTDVFTAFDLSALAYTKYGFGFSGGREIFAVTWNETGFYSSVRNGFGSDDRGRYDKRATFQIVLYRDNTFELNYDKVEYTAGEAQGINTLTGPRWLPPRVGFYLPPGPGYDPYGWVVENYYNMYPDQPPSGYVLPSFLQTFAGTGDHFNFELFVYPADIINSYELPGSGTGGETTAFDLFPVMNPSDLCDGGNRALATHSLNSPVLGRYFFGPPQGGWVVSRV